MKKLIWPALSGAALGVLGTHLIMGTPITWRAVVASLCAAPAGLVIGNLVSLASGRRRPHSVVIKGNHSVNGDLVFGDKQVINVGRKGGDR